MKLNYTATFLICALLPFAACQKKDNTPAQKKMLEAGKWQIIGSTATTNYLGKDTTVDLFAGMDACEKDDIITFFGNSTTTIDEGANKCAWDNQVETAGWVLLENNTKIAIYDSNPDTMDYEISSTQLKLKITKANSSGVPVYYISTYKNIN